MFLENPRGFIFVPKDLHHPLPYATIMQVLWPVKWVHIHYFCPVQIFWGKTLWSVPVFCVWLLTMMTLALMQLSLTPCLWSSLSTCRSTPSLDGSMLTSPSHRQVNHRLFVSQCRHTHTHTTLTVLFQVFTLIFRDLLFYVQWRHVLVMRLCK